MRFVLAIVALALAAVLLVTGTLLKFLAGPAMLTLDTTVSAPANYIVVAPSVLEHNKGEKNVVVTGKGTAFVGYGRTADVEAWLGDSSYTLLSYNKKTDAFVTKQVVSDTENAPATSKAVTDTVDAAIIDPNGSDLWVGQVQSEDSAGVAVPDARGYSAIVSGNGSSAAPAHISVGWPQPEITVLWMTDDMMIMLGGAFILVGLVLLLWAILHWRQNGRGPRRRGRLPRGTSGSTGGSGGQRMLGGRGRRGLPAAKFVALPAVGVAIAFGLSACNPLQSAGVSTPSPSVSAAAELQGPAPAVTEVQLAVIMDNISTTIAQADTAMDATLAETRLTGPALEARKANYAMRKSDGAIAALPSIPSAPIALLMPQATDSWPRTVMLVVQDKATKKDAKTVGVVLKQESARTNYHVHYLVNLEANQTVPEIAPATEGSPVVAPDSKLLLIAPDELAAAYANVLANGEASEFYDLFDENGDTLREQIATEHGQQTGNPDVAVTYTEQAGKAVPAALATLDSGAIVTVSMEEIAHFAPLNNKDLKLTGELKAIAGVEISAQPINATYTFMLSFYVPPTGSLQKIQLLGFTEDLTHAAAG